MLVNLFESLKRFKVPVSLTEFLSFLKALNTGMVNFEIENFYYLARTALVKNEQHIDRFDLAFSEVFKGLDTVTLDQIVEAINLPEEWLKKLAEKTLTPQERKEMDGIGDFNKLMETLKKRLQEQKGRHQGGSKWVGTAGTSPFGAYGYNPEGIRIGQNKSRHQKAVKVWDKRLFKNFDDKTELGTRSLKIALKKLRKWARDGLEEELDLEKTISETARSGYLNVKMRPERKNAVKVIIFFDVGGSMDHHIESVEELFSAARTAFKHLEYYYFHNCLYESVWRNNERRWEEQIPTIEVLNTYGKDYKCIFVGDASMSPYEVEMPGGANEHYNEETGRAWLKKAREQWPCNIWINPTSEEYWAYTQSINILSEIFEGKMVPLTLNGLDTGMKELM